MKTQVLSQEVLTEEYITNLEKSRVTQFNKKMSSEIKVKRDFKDKIKDLDSLDRIKKINSIISTIMEIDMINPTEASIIDQMKINMIIINLENLTIHNINLLMFRGDQKA